MNLSNFCFIFQFLDPLWNWVRHRANKIIIFIERSFLILINPVWSCFRYFISDDIDAPREDDEEEEEEDEWPPFKKVGQFDPYSDDPRLAVKKVYFCGNTGKEFYRTFNVLFFYLGAFCSVFYTVLSDLLHLRGNDMCSSVTFF